MDTKKYIIEIPDNTAWLQWVKVSDKDGHVCFDFKDPEDLTLYTEPNLDAVRKEAYDKGYQDATVKIGSDEQAIAEKAYQKGLNDAWDAARKIPLNVNEGGLSTNALTMIFGNKSIIQIFKELSASEVTEKIRQYEQKKEEQIRVGDEVITGAGKAVVVGVGPVHFEYVYADSTTGFDKVGNVKKTGRHFPEIAEVLKKIKGEEE